MVKGTVLTVSQLNFYIKSMFDSDSRLKNVYVSGEISNFVNHYGSGHFYFTLKDESAAVKAVMFARSASRLPFIPENGMRVIVKGRISVFERDGVYQMYADDMEPEGIGALAIAFEQLKNKLASEGLFDEDRKKPIPQFPERIGVITSATGAAVRDIRNVLGRRYPLAQIILYPAAVQGLDCPSENIKALEYFNKNRNVDVIIIGRGGGSIEDLWGYNNEKLARAVAASEIPVISGVGHETDFTLCDFAADLRAPTPSAAAELAVPSADDLKQYIESLVFRCRALINGHIVNRAVHLNELNNIINLNSPEKTVEKKKTELAYLTEKLDSAVENRLNNEYMSVDMLMQKLKILNPLDMLVKGYSAVYSGDKRINSVSGISSGDTLKLVFSDGHAVCTVNETVKR